MHVKLILAMKESAVGFAGGDVSPDLLAVGNVNGLFTSIRSFGAGMAVGSDQAYDLHKGTICNRMVREADHCTTHQQAVTERTRLSVSLPILEQSGAVAGGRHFSQGGSLLLLGGRASIGRSRKPHRRSRPALLETSARRLHGQGGRFSGDGV